MEREHEEEKVIISRRKLEELEQANNMLKLQMEEERRKFKESALYCINIPEINYFDRLYDVFGTVYSNSDIVKELSDQNEKLSEEKKELQEKIDLHKSYCNMPLYKRIFYAIKNNYNTRYV